MFAVIGNPNAASLTYYGLHSLQHRGQEGAGISVLDNDGEMHTIKGEGLLTDVFSDPAMLSKLPGTSGIGHIRYPSNGEKGYDNVQPLLMKMSDEKFAISYNGNITNTQALRRDLEAQGSVFHASGDAEILVHLIRRKKGTFLERLTASLLELEGAFNYFILHDSGVYAVRDRKGIRPLCIGKLADGGYVFASETCALGIVGATYIRDVMPGEIVYVEDGRIISSFFTEDRLHAICLMEYVYFARPDSDLEERNVHSFRKQSGIELCKETHVDADMVIGVPDSSISAANGYAEAAGLPNEMGLIKNRYVGRTFIKPTQALREQGVRMKLAPIPSVVKGKRVIVIDDSIVRGTTSRRIVQMLRDAGATEIHMRVSSPPIMYPCFYGVDTSHREDLLAHQLDLEEMRRHIKADSLAFLSREGTVRALKRSESLGPNCGVCMACFTGEYPTDVAHLSSK